MTKYWHPKKIEETRDSPGRAYSNRFLYENLSELLSKKEIKMLDIGCGSGYIREILYNLGYKLFYTGVDIKEHKDFKQFDKYALKSDFFKRLMASEERAPRLIAFSRISRGTWRGFASSSAV